MRDNLTFLEDVRTRLFFWRRHSLTGAYQNYLVHDFDVHLAVEDKQDYTSTLVTFWLWETIWQVRPAGEDELDHTFMLVIILAIRDSPIVGVGDNAYFFGHSFKFRWPAFFFGGFICGKHELSIFFQFQLIFTVCRSFFPFGSENGKNITQSAKLE